MAVHQHAEDRLGLAEHEGRLRESQNQGRGTAHHATALSTEIQVSRDPPFLRRPSGESSEEKRPGDRGAGDLFAHSSEWSLALPVCQTNSNALGRLDHQEPCKVRGKGLAKQCLERISQTSDAGREVCLVGPQIFSLPGAQRAACPEKDCVGLW